MKNKNGIIKALSFFLFTLFFVAVSASGFAQQKTVTGKIVDNGNQPLPGVTVVVKGTTQGTVSDIDGNFSITKVADENVLVFSFVGMLSQEIAVNSKSTINVTMQPDAIGIEEVVAIGYGTQKKATLTGSIETVSKEVFRDRAVSSPGLALQGQTPGLVVTRTSSQPGNEGLDFQIRGATSVNGGDPLIVIDGSPIINDDAFLSMSNDDIESISVLKDGSAAVYGSRAANGVILVTTKKGSGKTKVTINSNIRLNTIGIRPPVPTMAEHAAVFRSGTIEDDLTPGQSANYRAWQNSEYLARLENNEAGYYLANNGTKMWLENSNRFDELFGNSVSHETNVSISGSSEKSDYRISVGYAQNNGLLQPTDDGEDKVNIRVNYGVDVTDWLKVETGMSYFNTNASGPSTGLGREAISWDPPFWPAKNPMGQWYGTFGDNGGARNAIASVVDGGRKEQIEDQVKMNAAATFKLHRDLSFQATASLNKAFGDVDSYIVSVPQYNWDGVRTKNQVNSNPQYESTKTTVTYQTYGGFLNYNKIIGDHNFKAMVGLSAELRTNDRLYGKRLGFEDLGIYDLDVASGEVQSNQGGAGNWGLYGYVGRLNYAYKNKYLLELSGRRDGSSRFAEGFKFSNFGNVSIGWVISDESFLEPLSFISFLKLRASYGSTGNQVGIANHDYVSTINQGTGILGQTSAVQVTSANVGGITTTERTWERVGIYTLATDFQLLGNKLYGSFDYFQKKNDGMLVGINYPSILGGNAPKTNSGELVTKGWEAVLGYRETKGDFGYSIAVNLGDTKNELVSMEGVNIYSAGLNATVQGYPLNSYFLYQTDGFFKDYDEVEEYYTLYGNGGNITPYSNAERKLRAGDTKKVELDGSGAFESTGNIDDMNGDVKYMGDNAVHFNFGINLGLNYKGFDLSALFQGVFKQNVVRTGNMAYPLWRPWPQQRTSFLGKTWTEENTGAEYPRMSVVHQRNTWNWANNDFMMLNNRYIRMKTLIVGYNFDLRNNNVLKSVEKLRLYFSGNDLFEITSLDDGYDPEYGESTNNSYPFQRTFSMGVNVIF